jgi:hypothetical protein
MAIKTKFFLVQSSSMQVSTMGPTRLIGQSFSHVQSATRSSHSACNQKEARHNFCCKFFVVYIYGVKLSKDEKWLLDVEYKFVD